MRTLLRLPAIIATATISLTVFAQAGSLDGDFDADGKVIVTFPSLGPRPTIGNGIAAWGTKTYVAGTRLYSEIVDHQVAVARLNEDGSLDNSFGVGGKTTFYYGANFLLSECKAVAVQPDGKLIVVGEAQRSWSDTEWFGIARLNTNGTLDASFNGTGFNRINFVNNEDCTAWDVAVQSDGKIVVAGETRTTNNEINFAVARFNANGTLDMDFSTDGKVQVDFGASSARGRAVAIQGDGKILITGRYSNTEVAIARLNPNGTLDNTFGTAGKYRYNTTTFFANDMVVDASGRIVVAGGGVSRPSVLRVTASGTTDATFGTGGVVSFTPSEFDPYGSLNAVGLQCDGKIVAAGYSRNEAGTDNDMLVVRLNTNGTLDNTFSGDGIAFATFNAQSYNEVARGLIIRSSDQYITVAGSAIENGVSEGFGVARFKVENNIVPPAPTITFNASTCRLTASGSGTYSWRRSTLPIGLQIPIVGAGNGNTLTVTSAGYYHVSVTSPSGCRSNSSTYHLAQACQLTVDCAGIAGGTALPGTPCNDGNANTGNDTWSNDCVCIGEAIDCAGTIGGTALPGTPCNDGNAATLNDAWNANCVCVGSDCQGTPNGPALPGTPCNDGDPNTGNDTWTTDCDCVGETIDCTGAIGGPALPGTPCNDNDANTGNDTWNNECVCIGERIDCLGAIGGTALPGTPCDDGNAATLNDAWSANCVCVGETTDCLGVVGGTALPGTSCDDGNAATLNDAWSANCVCVGETTDCLGVVGGTALPGTPCDDGDPATINDTWIIGCTCIGAVGIHEAAMPIHRVNVFPNPAADHVTVAYTLAAATELGIHLNDVLGRNVATLLPRTHMPAGEQSQVLALPPDLAHGSYLLVLAGPDGRWAVKVSK